MYIFLKCNSLGDDQKCLKGLFEKSYMKPGPSNMVLVIHIKLFKNSFQKKVQKEIVRLLHPNLNSLIPVVFYSVKISIFHDTLCCNCLILLNSGPCQISLIETFSKLVNIFLAVKLF